MREGSIEDNIKLDSGLLSLDEIPLVGEQGLVKQLIERVEVIDMHQGDMRGSEAGVLAEKSGTI